MPFLRALSAILLLCCTGACAREEAKEVAVTPTQDGALSSGEPSSRPTHPDRLAPDRLAPDRLAPEPLAPDASVARLATFGGGCFWCTEAMFARLEGVLSVASGYAGGKTADPTYEEVSKGTTGHAEVIQVRFDPKRIGYDELLEVFFKTHDPTTPNRQGADVGTQYRSIVLFHDDAQRKVAEDVVRRLDAGQVFDGPIVTQLVPYDRFHAAEADHQDFYASNPTHRYCTAVIGPKVEKLEKVFRDRLKR